MNGYVYAVLFSDNWVKVGMTQYAPINRVNAHRAISSLRGAGMVDYVLSGRIVNCREAENRLINYCGQYGAAIYGREWFSGITFNDLKKIIKADYAGNSAEELKRSAAKYNARRCSALASLVDRFSNKNQKQVDKEWLCSRDMALSLEHYLVDMLGEGGCLKSRENNFSMFACFTSISLFRSGWARRVEIMDSVMSVETEGDLGDFLYSIESDVRNALQEEGIKYPIDINNPNEI